MTINAITINNVPDLGESVTGEENVLVSDSQGSSATKKTTLNSLKTLFGAASDASSSSTQANSSAQVNYFTKGEYAKRISIQFNSSSTATNEQFTEVYTTKQDEELYLHLKADFAVNTSTTIEDDAYVAIEVQMRTSDDSEDDWFRVCETPITSILGGTNRNIFVVDQHMYLQSGMSVRGHIYLGPDTSVTITHKNGSGIHGISTSQTAYPTKNYDDFVFLTDDYKEINAIKSGDAYQPFAVEMYLGGKSSVANTINAKFATQDTDDSEWTDYVDAGRKIYVTAKSEIGNVFLGKFYFKDVARVRIGINKTKSSSTNVYIRYKFCYDEGTLDNIQDVIAHTTGTTDSTMLKSNGTTGLSTFSSVKFLQDNNTIDVCLSNYNSSIPLMYGQYAANGIEYKVSDGDRAIFIQDGIETLGYRASNSQAVDKDLTDVRIGKGVTTITSKCFYSCSCLTSLTMSNSNIKTIGDYAFNSCKGLTTIQMPETVRTIGSYAFANITNIKNLYIPLKIESFSTHFLDSSPLKSKNNGNLYFIVSDTVTAREDIEGIVNSEDSKLGSLINVSCLKNNSCVEGYVCWENGTLFTYENKGKTYNVLIKISGVSLVGVTAVEVTES